MARQPDPSQLHIFRSLAQFAQNDDADENEVSTADIQKYVSVYKAMQRNRSLTVEQAAAAQGLTTEQFRQLENRVERDDAALQQARDELQAAAKGSLSPRPSP
jgi:DNA-binding transcriptional MerR regulator